MLIDKTGYSIDTIMNLPYPLFMDMTSFYGNPEEYLEGRLTSEEIAEKKSSLKDKLERLRNSED